MFEYRAEDEEEDNLLKEKGESTNNRMARVCKEAMNNVLEDLQFTVEVPEEFESKDYLRWISLSGWRTASSRTPTTRRG